jgi:outer membrane autotransporter protein
MPLKPHVLSVNIAGLLRASALGGLMLSAPFAALANCDNQAPATGQTTTCDSTAPNPETVGVQAAAGSTDVTVNVLGGAMLDIAGGAAIQVRDASTITNGGSIVLGAANTFDALFAEGSGNSVINNGSLTSSGAFADGIQTNGSNNTLTNTGIITASGDAANGIFSLGGSGNAVANSGTIEVGGADANGVRFLGGSGNTLVNTGTVRANGAGGNGVLDNSGASIINGGLIESAAASGIALSAGGMVTNQAGAAIHGQVTGITAGGGVTTIVNDGTIEAGTGAAINLDGNFNHSVTNRGDITAGSGGIAIQSGIGRDALTMLDGTITGNIVSGDGIDTLTLSGGVIDGSIFQGGDLDNAIISGGRITGSLSDGDRITVTGGRIGSIDMNIANNIMNMSGGEVDGDVTAGFQNDTLTFTGGRIGGSVDLDRGRNVVTIGGGEIVGGITTGRDVDTFAIQGGVIGVGIVTGDGSDLVAMSGGFVDGVIDTGAGDDAATWSGGGFASNGGGFNLGDGSDMLRVTGSPTFARAMLLDGGDDSSVQDGWIDVLSFDAALGRIPARTIHWEHVELINDTQLTYGGDTPDEPTEIDSATTVIDDTSSLTADPDAGDLLITGDVDNQGAIDASDGGGDVDIDGALDNSGTIDLSDSGGGLVVDGPTDNTGTIDSSDSGGDTVIGGELDNGGIVDISDGGGSLQVEDMVTNTGTIDSSNGGGDITTTGDIENSGVIDISGGGGTITTDGALTNTGTIEAAGGDSEIAAAGGLINDGLISLVDDATGDTLTINGDLQGDGTIAVDSNITSSGGDADTVFVIGDPDGTTNAVVNQEGDTIDGVPGVESGAAILIFLDGTAGDVVLNAPFNYTAIGPWRYELSDDNGTLRLRPRFDGEFAALTPSAAAATVGPEAVMAGVQQFLPSIREREGQTVLSRDGLPVGWLRAFGGSAELDGTGHDVGYGADTWGLQGAFGFAFEGSNGGLFAGGVTLGRIDSEWTPELRSARADLDVGGYAAGLYATWFADAAQAQGWYGDAIVQFSDFDLDIGIPVSPIASYGGQGFGAAIEVGYLSRRGDWLLEPQGRLVYLRSDLEAFGGLDGLQAQHNENDRLLARLGMRFSRDYGDATANGVFTVAYKAALWQQLGGDDAVVVGSFPLYANTPETLGEFGIGLDWKVGNTASFYAQLDGRFGGDYYDYAGEVGLRVHW